MVKGESFDVYFRDIIECVKALFVDEAFAPYLKFVPEKHYKDSSEDSEQLYHDMHTGTWWWSTQVRYLEHSHDLNSS